MEQTFFYLTYVSMITNENAKVFWKIFVFWEHFRLCENNEYLKTCEKLWNLQL